MAVIGFTYRSDGQLVRPAEEAHTGARSGPGFGKLKALVRYVAQFTGMVVK